MVIWLSPNEIKESILAQQLRSNTPTPKLSVLRFSLTISTLIVLLGGFFNPVKAENPPVMVDSSVAANQEIGYITNNININSLFQKDVNTVTITIVPSVFSSSSMVEQSPVKAKVVGSSPTLRANSGINYDGEMTIIAGYSPLYTNCYAYVASQRSIPHTRNGNAGTTPTNTKTPVVGAVAVMYNHVAIVQSFTSTTITVKEANVKKGYLDVRTIPRSVIYGYWN